MELSKHDQPLGEYASMAWDIWTYNIYKIIDAYHRDYGIDMYNNGIMKWMKWIIQALTHWPFGNVVGISNSYIWIHVTP